MSHDIVSGSDIMQCVKMDKPLSALRILQDI